MVQQIDLPLGDLSSRYGQNRRVQRLKNSRLAVTLAIGLCVNWGSQAQKKPLDHSVYDKWESIGGRILSDDGKWMALGIQPQEGDKNLFIRGLQSNRHMEIARGENPKFSSDSQFAVLTIKPFYADIRAVQIKKKKEAELTKDSLAIVNLEHLTTRKIAGVKSFKLAAEGGTQLAYLLEKAKDTTAAKAADSKDKDKDKKPEPLDLILLNLKTNQQTVYKEVVSYEFSKNGKQLVVVTQSPTMPKGIVSDSTAAKVDQTVHSYGVYLVETSTQSKKALWTGKAEFSQFAFDRSGSQLAFVGTESDEKALVKQQQLFLSQLPHPAVAVAFDGSEGMPKQWGVSAHRNLTFSEDGKKLYFGIAPWEVAKDTTLVVEDRAVVDIWNFKDDYLQSSQLKNLEKDLKKSYWAVLELSKSKRLLPLGDEKLSEATLVNKGDAHYVLASSDYKYRVESQWTGTRKKSYYTVDLNTGHRELIVADLDGTALTSPLGGYVVYFDRTQGNWYSYAVATKQRLLLNKGITASMVDETFDMPDWPHAYGIADWTAKDESVIVRDRYDLWEFSLNGKKPPRNITQGYGRSQKISFGLTRLDEDKRSVTRRETLILTAFNEENKQAGFYKTTVDSKEAPVKLTMEATYNQQALIKSKQAERYSFVKQSFEQSPNVWTTADFKSFEQQSWTNKQQSSYNWGTADLVYWTTTSGKPASGVLFKPEDFDASKSYPMIVYFYEKLSDNLHRYEAPAPTPSRLNISYFVSNGYLVFTPDVSYTNGYPGQSAEDYINSGVDMLEKFSWVDPQRVAIQGQSWGGYQVAHLITRTNRYAAAWSGAPVANMTSAYGGIRWESGMNRQMQYEKSQSRIGASLWESRDLYIENSPLFFLDRVETPVAIMHNDNDGAVPWYQGIEMFTALRRLNKPVWMLNYNGDAHNLMKRQNRKDIQVRQQQFFDYYLKGAAAPVWMVRGVPATSKGKDWGFDLTDEKI